MVARPATVPTEQEKRFLKPADINVIRQAELRPDEENVPIRFEHDVNRRYAKQLAQHAVMETANLPIWANEIEVS